MSTDDERPLMTSAEVAVIFRVDAKTVTEWARTGRVRFIRTPGGSLRFRESDVQALLDETRANPQTSRPGESPPSPPGGPGLDPPTPPGR